MEWGELAARVAEARMAKGLTQVQLSQALGLERSMVTKIESGQRKVSALELAAIARELGRRLEWFVLPRPTAIPQHRGGTDPERVTSEIDVVAEQAVADVALLIDLGHLAVPTRPPARERPASGAQAEDLAATARRLCGLDSTEPVTELVNTAWQLGLGVFAEPLEDGADAASITTNSWGVAVINSSRPLGRRRLAAAHELSHYLVGDQYVQDFRIDQPPSNDPSEARCDRFARAFLLPAPAVVDEWQRHRNAGGTRHAAVMTASRFRVDMSTLARRLHHDLGVIDDSHADQVRQVRTNQADIVENDLFVPHDLENVVMPGNYQRAVLSAYRADDITASRALTLLRGTFTEDGLPDLALLSEGALWALTQ